MFASNTSVQVADFKLDASRLRRCAEFATAFGRHLAQHGAQQDQHHGHHGVVGVTELSPRRWIWQIVEKFGSEAAAQEFLAFIEWANRPSEALECRSASCLRIGAADLWA